MRIAVTDTADTAAAVEVNQILLKLGTERGVLDRMNLTLESILNIMNNHACTLGSELKTPL